MTPGTIHHLNAHLVPHTSLFLSPSLPLSHHVWQVRALSGALTSVERLAGVTFRYLTDAFPERGFPASPQVRTSGCTPT